MALEKKSITFPFLNSYKISLKLKQFHMNWGFKLLIEVKIEDLLKISVARKCRWFWWIEIVLFIMSRSSYNFSYVSSTACSVLWYIFWTFYIKVFPANIWIIDALQNWLLICPIPYSRGPCSEFSAPYKCALLRIDTIRSPALYKNPTPVGTHWPEQIKNKLRTFQNRIPKNL